MGCVVASGYFNPLHAGHIRYLEDAKELADKHGHKLVVIVNNDGQVRQKGACPFMPEQERLAIVGALRFVDKAVLSVDDDRSVCRTLRVINSMDPVFYFVNGGDVESKSQCREAQVCEELSISLKFGVGGTQKLASSSELIARSRAN